MVSVTPARRRTALLKCSLKWGISLAIIAVLFTKTDFRQLTSGLQTNGLNPTKFSLGFLFCSFSVYLTLVRWKSLLTAFGVAIKTSEVMRIGLLSYALNLLALGSLGGDLGRAVLISKQQPGKREAVALSVAADRVIGLYAMIVLAFVLMAAEGLFTTDSITIRTIAWLSLAGTLLLPTGYAAARLTTTLSAKIQVRRCRFRTLQRIADIFDSRRDSITTKVLLQAFRTSLILRLTTAVGIWFFGTALISDAPGLRIHILAASIALLTGCLPLPLNGLGAFESMLEFSFQIFPDTPCPPGYGIAVALLYRMFLLTTGVIGILIYNLPRRERTAAARASISPQWDSVVVT
ncbi:MAG: flippase-like domain-containing protein [Planctomycetaceae bacterium]|nr:flippase-like domain-containing protein [Planctomycetaceae bacterium]